MRRPLAYRHLARIHELATEASICQVLLDRGLVSAELVGDNVAAERAIAEEALALARERGWKIPEHAPYEWPLVDGIADVHPRLYRVIERDVFELSEVYRDTDDDDVRSLAGELRSERNALKAFLERAAPAVSLPGAK